jgi:glyoxylase-like metal-dependent hydrolase (beta-lactamase superfamily II)
MFEATEIHQITPALFFWQAWSPEVRAELGCTALVLDGRLVFVDPIPLEKSLFGELLGRFPAQAIVITNANHERQSAELAAELKIPRYAQRKAAGEVEADFWVEEGDLLFGCLQVIELPGAADGEMALYFPALRLLVIGDALINMDTTGFTPLPAKYCNDAGQLRESLKKLLAISFEMMTFGHGLPLVHQAKSQLEILLTS